MPLGPNRAPGRYDVPVSKGAPKDLISPIHSVGSSSGHTYEGNVELLVAAIQAGPVWQTAKGSNARENGVSLQESMEVI